MIINDAVKRGRSQVRDTLGIVVEDTWSILMPGYRIWEMMLFVLE